MSQDSEAVACRVHPDVKEWLEEQAEDRGTTLGSYVEEELRKMYQDYRSQDLDEDDNLPEDSSADESGIQPEQAYERVYVPDSQKYDYAIRVRGSKNRYYKTKSGVISGIEREL